MNDKPQIEVQIINVDKGGMLSWTLEDTEKLVIKRDGKPAVIASTENLVLVDDEE